MEDLEKDEMQVVKGGGISLWVIAGISAAIVFLSGILDGFVNPNGYKD